MLTASRKRLIERQGRKLAALAREEECGLILNAIEVLRRQRTIAVKTFGERDPHIRELDDERAGLLDRARELGAAWA